MNGGTNGSGERALALAVMVAVVALLATVALGLVNKVHRDMLAAHGKIERARARTVADAGVSFAVLGMLYPGRDTRSRADGTDQELTFDGARLRVRIEDEQPKLDLDTAPVTRLCGLLQTVGADGADDLAAASASRCESELGVALSDFLGVVYPVPQSPLRMFTVVAEARMPSGATFVRRAVVALTGDPVSPYRFLTWEEQAAY
jgi:type II secretory pathway component PulK